MLTTLLTSGIGECNSDPDNCDTNAACTDTPGGFICTCNLGYTGSGVACTGKDSCVAHTLGDAYHFADIRY